MAAPDAFAPEAGRIDLPAARMRLFGLLALACLLTAACAWTLWAESGGRPVVAPGGFKQFAVLCGLALFGLGIPLLLREALRQGPIVSVSAKGLFDRRLSTDWIPWPAILGLDEVGIGKQGFLRLQVRPDLADTLPWTRRGRWTARLNGAYGGGYWIAGQGVRGGVPAIVEAVGRVRRRA